MTFLDFQSLCHLLTLVQACCGLIALVCRDLLAFIKFVQQNTQKHTGKRSRLVSLTRFAPVKTDVHLVKRLQNVNVIIPYG